MASEPTTDGMHGTQHAPTEAQKLHGGELIPDESDHDAEAGVSEKHDSANQDGDQTAKAEGKQAEQDQSKVEKQDNDKATKADKKPDEKKDDDKQPAGGYDSTPVPKRPRGWTVRITVHRASNLPMADMNTFSSDPYVLTQIYTDTPTRHKEDPPLVERTPSVRRSTDPEWNWPWTVANIPSSGFKLKLRLYDEDPGNHDDRLGNVHVNVNSMGDGFEAIKNQGYKIEKRAASKRATLVRVMTTCFGATKHMHGDLFLSIELLGRTPEDGQDGRLYTVGPCWWVTHFSPLLGRIAGTHDDEDQDDSGTTTEDKKQERQKKAEKFNFQANEIQLQGPVPKELYHRFVEFKPWVKKMFTASGILGWFASKALHAQHDRVYHFDRNTKWGRLPDNPGKELTKFFLEQVHYDQGGRIFTYVITLDGVWRFTETGKEFGIDMLSKHTMHSDVAVYIAFSGEFFIRRLKKPAEPPAPEPVEEASQSHPPQHEQNQSHPPKEIDGGAPKEDSPKDTRYYELVIDNDSGTYRPNAALLPLLKKFLAMHMPGLHILVLDCQKDADRMNKMKDEQRERKKAEGDGIVYLQGDDGSSISSSDEEDLDAMAAGSARHPDGPLKTAAKDLKFKEHARLAKVKRDLGGKERGQQQEQGEVDRGADEGSAAAPNQEQTTAGADPTT